jgi:hypothetical protein
MILAGTYDCVVANPPYMGTKGMNPQLKEFLRINFPDVKSDLFAAFIVRNCAFTEAEGYLGFMTPFVWMFISSYEKLRTYLINEKTITSLIQLEYSGFDGATVPICNSRISREDMSGCLISEGRQSREKRRWKSFRRPGKQANNHEISRHDPCA